MRGTDVPIRDVSISLFRFESTGETKGSRSTLVERSQKHVETSNFRPHLRTLTPKLEQSSHHQSKRSK